VTMADLPAETVARWRKEPRRFVREALGATPDAWQDEALAAFPTVNRLAMKACKGPGKTAVIAWLILNFLVTRPQAKIGATAITGDNLRDNLWAELAKWRARSELLRETTTWTKTRLSVNEAPETWFVTARQWPKQADAQRQADTLAGLHADFVMFVLDESGGIPQAVMATAEAVLASGVECKVVQAGNPTQLDGPLYRACVTDRHLWHVVNITGDPDAPNRSPRISLEWAREQIATWGRDNPWVMVNVLGEFPPASLNALLGPEDIEAAMARKLRPEVYEWAQKRIGVDVARFGDDRTVLFPRQGLMALRPRVMRHPRGSAVSTHIATAVLAGKTRWGSELELMDVTGGWAAGARDILLTSGVPVIELNFGGQALDPRYENRRAELWFGMAQWVKGGGWLPKLPELVGELVTPTYTFSKRGKFLVEPKDLVKERLGRSPDLADALATTFGMPEMPNELMAKLQHRGRVAHDADPFQMPTEG
jgi:phage terminase large subunit